MRGLPAAPPVGQLMLPAGTYDRSVVVVTGGGTGLGKGIAVELARLGAALVIAQRKPEHRASGIAAVQAVGGKAIGIALDVRHAAQVAGRSTRTRPSSVRWTCWSTTPPAAWTGGPGTAASTAAKAGVTNLTMSLAVEWAPHGIRVNTLAAGLFPHDDHPPAMDSAKPSDPTAQARTVPAGRVGGLQELGYAATYMCSPYANYLSGHTLVLDGANWLRRSLAMPEFVPIGEQPGFTPLGGWLLQDVHATGGADADHVCEADLRTLDLP